MRISSDVPTPFVEGRRIEVRGIVQGVGFRPWVYRLAGELGVTGTVRNTTAGVTIEAFANRRRLDEFVRRLRSEAPQAARIDDLACAAIDAEPAERFVIAISRTDAEPHVSIPPDLATCGDCVSEIFDPANRRYRYAFTNCTNCGPRFTIAAGTPYDRSTTTMASFEMCPKCRREYADPGDRRFHAQPNACPACGPSLVLTACDGTPIDTRDPIRAAVSALHDGLIVAIKGLGGFHLACDAMSYDAVAQLRVRKRRDEKPFAIMVRDIVAAEAIALVGSQERSLLTSVEHPIVLVPKREVDCVATNVAPDNRLIGLMLPYTPLHHLLLAEAARPLVMTSGNLSDEPIAYRNHEAIERLGAIADVFLLHDRTIETRCDDSVATVIADRGVVLRRSRGHVPRAIRTRRSFAKPVLACGALLKNTFCLAAGDSAFLGPHIGDLENLDAFDSYVGSIARLERFLEIQPEIVAYDLHPDYLSTAYANTRPERMKIPIQHHHAHIVSAMAEHQLEGPVIGVAYDGTGYGTDGTMWGGEIMRATFSAFERTATFRPIRLAGGDQAVREPWRIALALVLDSYDGEPPLHALSLVRSRANGAFGEVWHLLRHRTGVLARGVGRYFDAFGALFLDRATVSFEGQLALEWNQAADPAVTRAYPFDIVAGTHWALDLAPAVRAAIADRWRDTPASAISAAFHNTLADATAALVKRTSAAGGHLPVVLTGGCFQNRRLAESVKSALEPEHDVFLHHAVPPGDGGIALGQAVAADAIVRKA